MASFFEDVFDAFTGQKATPQQTIIGTNDLLGQSGQLIQNQIVPQTLAYNQAIAPGLTDVQLGVERQYDPNAFALRSATTKSILDNLGLGSSLPPEIQDLVVRNALEGASASGFGASPGGRGLVARDLGLTGLDLGRSRRDEALKATRTQTPLDRLWNPQLPYGQSPGMALAGDLRDVQAAQDNYANLVEDTRRKNFASLLNTGGRIIGGIVGGVVSSGSPQGIEAGKSIGGSVFGGSGVAGVNSGNQNSSQGMGGFTSILSGLFGGGRPNSVKAEGIPNVYGDSDSFYGG